MTQRAVRRLDDDDEADAPGRRPRTARRGRASAAADIEEMFERQRTPASALPDPSPLVLNLARCAVEVMAGVRDAEQIARWLEPDVHAHLQQRAVLSARKRQATGRRPIAPTISLGSCRIDHPAADAVEACVVVHTTGRSRSVVIRLAGIDGRWRATALEVLGGGW
ncbi:MAG: 3-hydroxyacyl-CoA dehydrogenase [Microbacteriaceae bacterium]|nr:3-hydroxyacyl-CoA dehydrogenase [Microbacteriaceae bacterium]